MDGKIKFYNSLFCPYAQRTWITLNHFKIEYEFIQGYTVTQDGTYDKNPDLLKVNPKGLVPTLHLPNGEVILPLKIISNIIIS